MKLKKIGHFILTSIFSIFLIACVLVSYHVYQQTRNLPTISKETLQSDASSNMYARDGQLIWSSAINKRTYVKYQDLPQDYIKLLLATEDRGYFHDRAISPKGVAGAAVSLVKAKLGKGTVRGGSTIEQQLIKLSVFSTSQKDRNIDRKIKEAFLASQMEHNFSKKQILEFYVNKIFLGEGSYGAQTIAKTYYGKPLKELNLSQLAIIAGLGQAGSYYNLYDRPQVVEIRRNQVLKSGLTCKAITKKQYLTAKNTPIQAGLKKRHWEAHELAPMQKAHAAYISGTLTELANQGYNLDKTPLQIHTNLDVKLNELVNDTFDNHPEFFQNKRQQAAMTIMNPQNGQVLAQNGGRFNHKFTNLNRAIETNRSSGSAIKPINVYGPALQYLGWGTGHMLDSSKYTYAGTNITATNFGGASYGMVTMKRALAESLNTPAIRTLDAVGPYRAKVFANNLGIDQEKPIAGSSALGMNASTLQMAAAYSAFANGGTYYEPEYVNYLIFPDRSKRQMKPSHQRAMSPAASYIMNKTLQQVYRAKNGTLHDGYTRRLKNMAAKTGTVAYPNHANVPDDSAMDFWTCSYNKDISIALWEGFDQPMKPNNFLWDQQTIKLRARLWRYLVPKIVQGKDMSDWKRPKGVGGDSANLYVLQRSIIKPLTGLTPIKLTKQEQQVIAIKKVKQNRQRQFDIPKDYDLGEWKKRFNQVSRKATKQDNKQYKHVPTETYDLK